MLLLLSVLQCRSEEIDRTPLMECVSPEAIDMGVRCDVMVEKCTYSISSSANPLIACSSRQVIWLLSSWRLRSEVAPLNARFGMAERALCDRSLQGTNG